MKKLGNVHVLDTRISCKLDTFSLVEAALELMKASVGKYKYHALLSGQDYLLATPDKIVEYLSEVYPRNFINCIPHSDNRNWVWHKTNFCASYQKITRKIRGGIKNGFISKCAQMPFFVLNKLLSPAFSIKKKCDRLGIDVYGGDAWRIISDKLAEYILKEVETNKNSLWFAQSVNTPEEIFFPTMAVASKLSVEINADNEVTSRTCKTYPYFDEVFFTGPEGNTKPMKGHPYVFTMEDIDRIKILADAGFFFARKFDFEVDIEVVYEIDKVLLGK